MVGSVRPICDFAAPHCGQAPTSSSRPLRTAHTTISCFVLAPSLSWIRYTVFRTVVGLAPSSSAIWAYDRPLANMAGVSLSRDVSRSTLRWGGG